MIRRKTIKKIWQILAFILIIGMAFVYTILPSIGGSGVRSPHGG